MRPLELFEGGAKSRKTKGVTLDPPLAKAAIVEYLKVIKAFNVFLDYEGHKPVTPIKPVGSTTHLEKDYDEKVGEPYGDIDYQVQFPLEHFQKYGDERLAATAQKRLYENLLKEFLNSQQPDNVDVPETLNGSPLMIIMKLPTGEHVQIDTIVTFPQTTDWMKVRYGPERGIKGYMMGNLYKAFGDYFTLVIGTEGVVGRKHQGRVVSSSRRKDVNHFRITKDPRTLFKDIAQWAAHHSEKQYTEHPELTDNGGLENESAIVKMSQGIRGVALTLEQSNVIPSAKKMLKKIHKDFEDLTRKSIDNKLKRGTGLDPSKWQNLANQNEVVSKLVRGVFEAEMHTPLESAILKAKGTLFQKYTPAEEQAFIEAGFTTHTKEDAKRFARKDEYPTENFPTKDGQTVKVYYWPNKEIGKPYTVYN